MASSTSDSAVDPVEQLLDLFLYAPIGLVAKGVDGLPDLVERGRSQAANARVVGQFALGATNAKARKSLADAESHLAAFLKIVADSARPTRSTTASSVPEEQSQPTATSSLDDIVEGYDDLTAAQVLPLLASLSDEQLERVESYEQSHRSRKTILNRIRQLRS